MDSTIVLLVLLAAVLHAGWNTLVKIDGDRLIVMALITAGAGAVSVTALPFVDPPARASWPYLAMSVALHTGYNLLLLAAYRHGDLSQVYPIARGSAPLIVLGLALVFAGEAIKGETLVAVLVITAGILSLAARGDRSLTRDPRPVLYALGTALFIAGYTVVDGLGARRAGTPHGYAAWLFILNGIPVATIAIATRGRTALQASRRVVGRGLAGGTMSLAAYWLVIWALTLGPMAPVAALRETSVVLAAVIGALALREGFGPWRVTAASFVTVGILLLHV